VKKSQEGTLILYLKKQYAISIFKYHHLFCPCDTFSDSNLTCYRYNEDELKNEREIDDYLYHSDLLSLGSVFKQSQQK
jgi:hypothetical protein